MIVYEHGVKMKRELQDTTAMIETIINLIFPIALFAMLMFFMSKRMGGVGKSTAKVYMEKETGVTFADVAGEDEAKEALVELEFRRVLFRSRGKGSVLLPFRIRFYGTLCRCRSIESQKPV